MSHDVTLSSARDIKVNKDLKPLKKRVIQPKFHLSAYVNESTTLSELVKLGVNLTQIQKAADMVIKLDFEKDVKPILLFLHDIGIPDSELGQYISKNPFIFKEDLYNLRVRINYLESKRFPASDIVRIVTKSNIFLLVSVKRIDSRLGYFQKEYKLTGDEVRSVVTRQPKLTTWNQQSLMDTRFYIKEFLGFSVPELKQLLIQNPKMFLANKYSIGKRFDYLHNVVGFSHEALLQWPKVFNTRLRVIQERHRYLLSIERGQYDPTKENYVSLEALSTGTDGIFCKSVAKTSVMQFNNFLKSI